MSTLPSEDNEDSDNGVLVMNFWEDGEDFPAPMKTESDNYLENDTDSEEIDEFFEDKNGIKIENDTMVVEDSKETLKEFLFGTPTAQEEYILGTDATTDILAIARNSKFADSESVQVQNQADLDVIVLDSDSDDDDTPGNSSHIPHVIQSVVLNNDTLDDNGSHEESSTIDKASNLSAIIITNVESVVKSSKNSSTSQVQESIVGEALHTSEANMVVENKDVQNSLVGKNRNDSKEKFKCELCPFAGMTRFSLSRHIILHTNTETEKDPQPTNIKNTLCQSSVESKVAKESLEHKDLEKDLAPKDSKTLLKPKDSEISKTNIFKCRFCSFTSKIRFALKRHTLLMHKGSFNYMCNYCHFVTKSKVGLVNHIRSHKIAKTNFTRVERKLFVCQKCNFKTPNNTYYLKHVETNKNRRHCAGPGRPSAGINKVKITKTVRKTDNIFIAMPKTHSVDAEKKFVCQRCTFKAPNEQRYRKHILINKNRRTCRGRPAGMRSQIKTTGMVPGPDNISENNVTNMKEGKTTSQSTISKKESTDCSRKYQCDFCSFNTKQAYQFRIHRIVHTKYNQPIYSCQKCGFKSTATILRKHMPQEHGVKFYLPVNLKKTNMILRPDNISKNNVTDMEDGTTTSQSIISKDESTDGSRKYRCEFCSFSTKQAYQFRVHRIAHTKYNKPIYPCNRCSFKSTATVLKKHVSKVHGLTIRLPAPTIGCPSSTKKKIGAESGLDGTKTFQIQQERKNLKSSTGELNQSDDKSSLNFQCSYCSHVSKNIRNFTIHRTLHTKYKEPIYHCNNCNYRATKSALKEHMNIHRVEQFKNDDKNDSKPQLNIRKSEEINSLENDRGQNYESNHKVQSLNTSSSRLRRSVHHATVGGLTSFKDQSQLLDKTTRITSDFHSNALLYVCEICDFVTNEKETLLIHKLTHSGLSLPKDEQKINCSVSKYKVEDTNQSTNNLELASKTDIPSNKDEPERVFVFLEDGRRQCSVCSGIFATSRGFSNHSCEKEYEFSTFVTLGDLGFICKVCSFSTPNKTSITSHLVVHKSFEKAAVFKCSKCDFRTKYKSNLWIHLTNIHKEKRPQQPSNARYNCDICNFKTNSHRVIRSHKLNSHEEALTCNICGYKTHFPAVLLNHKKYIHKLDESEDNKIDEASKDIEYKCDACDFKTNYKHNLQNHKVLHININEFRVYKNKTYNFKINKGKGRKASSQAKVCSSNGNKKPTTKSNKTSTPESKLSCDLCSYSTVSSPSFLNHQYIHKCKQEGRLYTCNGCSYSTVVPRYLDLHKKRSKTCSTPEEAELFNNKKLRNSKQSTDRDNSSQKSNTILEINESNKSQVTAESTESRRQFGCKHCDYKTTIRFKLKKHFEKRHSKNPEGKNHRKLSEGSKRKIKLFKCNSCFYVTKYQHSLNYHYNACHVEK